MYSIIYRRELKEYKKANRFRGVHPATVLCNFTLENFSYILYLYYLMFSINDIWIILYFQNQFSPVFHGIILFFLYISLISKHFWAIKCSVEFAMSYKWGFCISNLFAAVMPLMILCFMVMSGFIFDTFIMKILVNPANDLLFYTQILIWLPRIFANLWYK